VSYLHAAQVRDVAKTVTLRQQDLLMVESEWDELKILSGLNWVRLNIYCDKLFTDIHSELDSVDKYDIEIRDCIFV